MKYTLTEQTRRYQGRVLRRIRALKNFGVVRKGDMGGWVESCDNLSQDGECWLHNDSKAYGRAKIRDNARLAGNARASDHAVVEEQARMMGNTQAFDHANIKGCATIAGFVRLFHYACAADSCRVAGSVHLSGNVCVGGEAYLCDSVWVTENAIVNGKARLRNNVRVHGGALVTENAKLHGMARAGGTVVVAGDAELGGCMAVFADRITYAPIGLAGFGYHLTITKNYVTINGDTLYFDEVKTGPYKDRGVLDVYYRYERILKRLHKEKFCHESEVKCEEYEIGRRRGEKLFSPNSLSARKASPKRLGNAPMS